MSGPYDLAASLGHPAEFDNPVFKNAVNEVKRHIPNEKMAVHIPKDVEKEIKKYDGYGIIAVGMDTTSLIETHRKLQDA